MRYMVDGKNATKDQYDHAPAGKCKSVSTVDSDETIARSYLTRAETTTPVEADFLIAAAEGLVPGIVDRVKAERRAGK